jgi:hypothetical protein
MQTILLGGDSERDIMNQALGSVVLIAGDAVIVGAGRRSPSEAQTDAEDANDVPYRIVAVDAQAHTFTVRGSGAG